MTGLGRALAGAAFGALLTLVAHPVSRPYLLSVARPIRLAEVEQCLDSRSSQPAPPEDLLGASLWVQLALERLANREAPLRPKEMETVLRIAEQAAERDPDNAYWNQSRAAILMAAGQPMEARATWIRASRASRWNDYQADRLNRSQSAIASKVGISQAWQIAYVFHHRSSAAATSLERFARTLLAGADPTTEEGLTVRYATLVNGNLIRSGARGVAIGERGANIVDLTTYPADMAKTPSPRRLWTGQTEMLDRMARMGPIWSQRSDHARAVFKSNEGWRAMYADDDVRSVPQRLSLGAVLTSGITGAILVVAFAGVVIYAAGTLIHRFLGNRTSLSWPAVAGITVLLGSAAFWLSGDLFASAATALCAGFLGVSPSQIRRIRPEDLGPLFATVVGTLALLFGLTVTAFLIGTTSAASALLPLVGVPEDYFGTTLFLGLAAVFLGLLLLAVPMWGMAQRVAIPHLLGLALRKFGAALSIGSLCLGILLTPIAVFADRQISSTMNQLVGNEWLYYYLQQ